MTGRVIEYQDTWHPCKVVYWLTWHPLGRGVADRLPRSLLLSGGSLSSLGEGFRGACSLPPLWRHTWLYQEVKKSDEQHFKEDKKLASKAIQNKPEKEFSETVPQGWEQLGRKTKEGLERQTWVDFCSWLSPGFKKTKRSRSKEAWNQNLLLLQLHQNLHPEYLQCLLPNPALIPPWSPFWGFLYIRFAHLILLTSRSMTKQGG